MWDAGERRTYVVLNSQGKWRNKYEMEKQTFMMGRRDIRVTDINISFC